jgi:hypothetical protein
MIPREGGMLGDPGKERKFKNTLSCEGRSVKA